MIARYGRVARAMQSSTGGLHSSFRGILQVIAVSEILLETAKLLFKSSYTFKNHPVDFSITAHREITSYIHIPNLYYTTVKNARNLGSFPYLSKLLDVLLY